MMESKSGSVAQLNIISAWAQGVGEDGGSVHIFPERCIASLKYAYLHSGAG